MKNTLRTLGMLAVCAATLGSMTRPASADKIITGGADKKVKVWDAATGKMIHEMDAHDGAVTAMALSWDGKMVATGGTDKKVKLWNTADGKMTKEIAAHDKTVTALWFTLDNEKLVSGSADKKLKVWDLANGKEARAIADVNEGDVIGVVVTPEPNAMTITVGKEGFVKIWDGSGTKLIEFEHEGGITSSAINPNPMQAELYTGGKAGAIKFWSQAGSGDYGDTQGSAVNAMVVTADGKKLLTGGADGKLKIWDTDTKKLLGTVDSGHKGGINAIALDPKAKVIVTGGADGKVKIWDAETKKNLATVEDAHKDGVNAILYLADKKETKPEEKKPEVKK